MKKIYTITAVKHEKGYYHHFGIHPMTAPIFGDDPKDIVEVDFIIDDDQSVPPDYIEPCDYWGWIDKKEDELSTLTFPQRFLLNMCFPYGIEASEDKGEGKAYRLKLVQ